MWRFIIIFAMVCFCGRVSNASSAPLPACLLWGFSSNRRDDYTYTAGVGAHKVHTRPLPWNRARKTCDEEGGHLAIINSVAEANVIANLLPQGNIVFAHIGHHDFFDKGEFVTVHGQTLAKAGYTQWAPGQPVLSPGENCGGMDNTGKLHDMICTDHCPFVCELSVD